MTLLAPLAGQNLAALSTEELRSWSEGPVQWLFVPDERKELKQIDEPSEALSFIETFWRRRDRTPEEAGNPYRESFFERVEAADILYSEEGIRGSLTDRGRALILMGPPTHVTVTTEPVMTWDPVSNAGDRFTTRNANVEKWGYRLEDLPDGMLQIWIGQKKKAAEDTLTLTLMFRNTGRRTLLVEGERLLEAAVLAAVYRDGD